MTNKEGDQSCDPRLAGLLAVHLVGQVLEEAYVIANAARETGQPWRHLSMLRCSNLRNSKVDEILNADDSYSSSKDDGDDETSDNGVDISANIIITSTPQKVLSERMKTENVLIGQGDEEFEMQDNEFDNSTSMFINHLFDMSEVEKVIICDDDNEIVLRDSAPNLPPQDVAIIMESHVNSALTMAFMKETDKTEIDINRNSSGSTDYSCYSLLSDAFVDIAKDVALFIEDGVSKIREIPLVVNVEEIRELREVEDKEDEINSKNDAELYENAYLTLNRDYEQFSEEEIVPILEDPNVVALQEVELMTAHTSEEHISSECEEAQKRKELAATSAVSASSRKSLVQRCRTQGARLLACLRGWWRRKTPGKRKASRVSGSIRGLCPLSPEARRRTASMLEQRNLGSPTPSHAVVWKFNTVNEALVNSSHWKEYTFDVNPNDCGEF